MALAGGQNLSLPMNRMPRKHFLCLKTLEKLLEEYFIQVLSVQIKQKKVIEEKRRN